MKKFYILALVAAMFAACSTDVTEDVAIEAPETLKVSFEESSRIQLDNNKTVWTKGDLVSVFYRSDANQQWKFQGNTGDRSGSIKRVSTPEYSHTTSKMVVAYPYNENYYLNPETCNLQAFLPAEQTYLKDSYGINGNIMVSQSEYKQFVLKSVCGWLRIRLIGNGEKVQSIKLKGNNGEQVAGEIYVNTADATSILAAEMGFSSDHTQVGGTMVEDDTILTEVTLDCDEGVTLGTKSTAFNIGLPPQEFSKGLTIEIVCSDGSTMTKSTDNTITIERNRIVPMTVFEFANTTPATNKIWYTSSDGNIVTPYASDVFGANIVSNTYENDKGVITFDGPITLIGENAFNSCDKLRSITLPKSLTTIGARAFSNCNGLTKCTIPDSVTEIGYYAFMDCTLLKSITIPDSVTSFMHGVFHNCTSLIAFYGKFASADNRCLIVNGMLHSFARAGLTEYTVPDSVTEIGGSVFFGCKSLTSITIPDSVTKIGSSAFQGCTSLTSITIPNSVTEIGMDAFYECTSLTSVTIPDSVTSFGQGVFHNCSSLKEIYYIGDLSTWCKINFVSSSANPMNNGAKLYLNGEELTGNVTFPSDVTEIKDYTFYGYSLMTSVTIPDSVTSIGRGVFLKCTSLTSVTIGNRVSSIGEGAFSNCSSLRSVTFSDSVTSIGDEAFYKCTSLISVTIPDSVTSIGSSAFSNCSSLKEAYCKPITPPSGGANTFRNNASGRKIYVPRASLDTYKTAKYWKSLAADYVPYDFE